MFDSYHVSVAFVFIAPFLRHAAIFVAQFSLHNFLLQVFFPPKAMYLRFTLKIRFDPNLIHANNAIKTIRSLLSVGSATIWYLVHVS